MANPSIRGHQGVIKYFQDGAQAPFVALKKVDINQDSTFMRSYYTGQALPEGDQAIEGWSGSVEAEVKDASMDEFIDALVTANLNGIGVSDYTMTSTESYTDGSEKSYVYFDMQFKLSRNQEGLQSKITKRLEFQASGRQPL